MLTTLLPLRTRAGFTPSGAPVQKNVRAPPPTAFTRHAHCSNHRHFVEDPCCNAHYYRPCTGNEPSWLHELATREHWTLWQSMMPARHTKSFPLFPNHYFNISGLLPCCKKWKNVLLWGPLFGRTCWTCPNPPLLRTIS